MKIEDIKKYLEVAREISWKRFQERFNKKEKDAEYWRGRCNSYDDLYYKILRREEQREHLKLE